MRPHADDFDRADFAEDLADEAMVNVDAPGIGAGQVADELLKCRRILKRVAAQQFEQRFGLRAKAGLRQSAGIAPGLAGKHKFPAHHRSPRRHFETGVLRPRRMDSRMPGMEMR